MANEQAGGKGMLTKVAPIVVFVAIGLVVLWQQRQSGTTGSSAPATGASAPASAARPSAPTRSGDVTPPTPSAPPKGAPATASGPSPKTSSPTPAPPVASATLKVGSWNIEWLGKPEDRAQFAQNVAQSPDTMGEYIVGSGVSVLGVAEVVTTIPGSPMRSRELEATIAAIKKKNGQEWEYALCPGRQDGDQLTGFMWNSTLVTAFNVDGQPWRQSIDVPWRVPIKEGRSSSGSRLWARPPHAIKFSAGAGKTDFVVIVLHMKADYNGQFDAHRKLEMDALIEALPAVRARFKDEDIVLTGDTNVTRGDEPAIADLVNARFVDLNSRNVSTTWRDGFTDRTFVPANQAEFASHEFWVFSDPFLSKMRWKAGDFKKNLSDHYMVGTTLRVMDDDD